MRWVRFDAGERPRIGRLEGDLVRPVAAERIEDVIAGRGTEPGRVLLQTYNPASEPIQRVVAHDFAGFAEQELQWRRSLAYPPYARLAAVRVEGEQADATANARVAAAQARRGREIRVTGMARGWHRMAVTWRIADTTLPAGHRVFAEVVEPLGWLA